MLDDSDEKMDTLEAVKMMNRRVQGEKAQWGGRPSSTG